MKEHYYYFCGDINANTVNVLVEELQEKDRVNLWFDSEGGYVDAMSFLVHFLNSRKDSIEVTLVGELCSAATYLLTDFEGKVNISEGLDYIMFHKTDRRSYMLREQMVETKEIVKQDQRTNEVFSHKLSKIGLTEKEIRRYNSGKDVVLYRKDFNRLILPQNRKA